MSGIFRPLRADEIDCRVGTCSQKGVSLLLYQDARAAMTILDETVGALNWQKSYSRDNANCIISIWDADKAQWISKEDTGTESNTEKEKGLASDSFKRAAVNFGIGRELYSAPFIWIPSEKIKMEQRNNGTWTTREKFVVDEIQYNRDVITRLVITCKGQPVYTYGKRQDEPKKQPGPDVLIPDGTDPDNMVSHHAANVLAGECVRIGTDYHRICEKFSVSQLDYLNWRQWSAAMRWALSKPTKTAAEESDAKVLGII